MSKNDKKIEEIEKKEKKIKKTKKNEKNVKKTKENEKERQLKDEVETKKKNKKKKNKMWQFNNMFENLSLNKFMFSTFLLNENDMKFIDNKLKAVKNNDENNDENENNKTMMKELKISYNLLTCQQ